MRYQRSFKLTCENCGWYVILRRSGGMVSMLINTFTSCPKCKGTKLITTKPNLIETLSPMEQFRKYYYKITSKKGDI